MAKTLAQLLHDTYGLKTGYRINPVTGVILTTPTKILGYNPNRVGLVIINNGSQTAYIKPNKEVAVNSGLYLFAGGSGISFTWDRDFEFLTSEFYGITDVASSNVYIQELISID